MYNNLEQQSDEIEALTSIFGTQFQCEADGSYSFQLQSNLKLFVTLNEDYPSTLPPEYQLFAPNLDQQTKKTISSEFHNIYTSNMGNPILYQWIDKLKEIIAAHNTSKTTGVKPQAQSGNSNLAIKEIGSKLKIDNMTHGSLVQDRKSTFQGHCCRVKSSDDVKSALATLMEIKKVANATHNMYAYRIRTSNGNILQDCDDDGENHAGGRILHLLNVLNVENVIVVVSRWFGGIQLGPDRFKHINNAARQVLIEANLIELI